jgi:hypothetical protein
VERYESSITFTVLTGHGSGAGAMRAVISIRRIAAEDVIAKLFADFSSDSIWDLISLTSLLVCRSGPSGFDIFPLFLFLENSRSRLEGGS